MQTATQPRPWQGRSPEFAGVYSTAGRSSCDSRRAACARGDAMGNVIDLKPAHLEDDELIENLARFADGTLSEAAVKARHHLSNEDWVTLGESDRLVELAEAAKLRRVRPRAHKSGGAQNENAPGPPNPGKNNPEP